jgi:hypothetical protein
VAVKNVYLSKNEVKNSLLKLQTQKSETPNFDAKLILNLKEDGDRALFIKHIAALANNGQRSYLFIGVEDKTWLPKGIPEDSFLLETDGSQQQMNNILARRIDPQISVCYQVYDLDGSQIGVVGLEGEKPPYIISIEEDKFGSAKTRGENYYIQKGSVFIRRGTDSIIANRQIDLLSLLNERTNIFGLVTSLIFIAILIAICIGIGISLKIFPNPFTASLFGLFVGVIIGYLFNNRVADSLGKYPTSKLIQFVKNSGGIIWGGAIGTFFSYNFVNSVLLGKLKVLDPLNMSLTLSMAIGFIVLCAVIIVFIEFKIIDFFMRKYLAK